MGSFVRAFGRALPVRRSTDVRRVRWVDGGVSVEHRWRIRGNTGGVSVETNVGTLDAQASLITVPTGVLETGEFHFDPPLPDWKLDAIDRVPMGLLNKIALQFDRDIFETEADT